MCDGIKMMVYLLLITFALLFQISGQSVNIKYTHSQSGNGSVGLVSQSHLNSYFSVFFPGAQDKERGFFIKPWWKYGLSIILFLLMLWFYRKYEIRRIKHRNSLHNNDYNSEVSSESIDSNSHLYSAGEEKIDQCLTGWGNKRFCFFYADGNLIRIENHIDTCSEPASVEMLLTKINAKKFCEHVCLSNEKPKFPASSYVTKVNINGKNKLSESLYYRFQIQPFNLLKELNHSADLPSFSSYNSFIHLRDAAVSPIDKDFYLSAVKIIEVHYADYWFSVEQLARELNMSVSQVNRKLNFLTGIPAGRLISKFRLQHASECLIHGTDSISDVCFSAGYNGLAYFSRAFKREFGCTPSVYRQLMTKKSISVRK